MAVKLMLLTALGSNLPSLWTLVANARMQNPVGAEFSSETMRMEMSGFSELLFNPVAQVKFVHSASWIYGGAARGCPWRWRAA
ncbi:MAG TPA: cytochrome ubiquinol oxidase subunit I [Thiohalobacter sp.]|nr:cytochrome ubiquinol oxidase subunit I [Thiohalobacter sp.]